MAEGAEVSEVGSISIRVSRQLNLRTFVARTSEPEPRSGATLRRHRALKRRNEPPPAH